VTSVVYNRFRGAQQKWLETGAGGPAA